jgi:transcriptional antiterminator RfaH
VSAPHQCFSREVPAAGQDPEMPLLTLESYIHPADLLAEPFPQDVGDMRWWVLHTRPRAEKALARRFHGRELPYFLPLHERRWRNGGRHLRSFSPLFPGYVFLHGDAEARLIALETNLVAKVLCVEDQGQLHADLRRVFQLLSTGAPVSPEDRLGAGDLVEIVKGPFEGLCGKILRRGKQLRFAVEVQFLRQAVSVELEGWMIQPASPAMMIAD